MLSPDAASYVWQVRLLATQAGSKHGGALSWLAFYADKDPGQKQAGEERVYFILQFQSIQGSQGRNVKVGSETEAMGGYCLLTCSPWLAQPAALNTAQDHLPGSGAAKWAGPPTSVIH